MSKNDFENLSVRTDDLCRRCERRLSPLFTGFLSPEEQAKVLDAAKDYSGIFTLSFGGFKEAERNVVGFFPDSVYLYPETEAELGVYREMAEISFVKISGSGFVNISHRDVLGSLMALGLKRETLGDILVTEDAKCAYVAVSVTVRDYILANLERVARDKVKTSSVNENEIPEKKQRFSDMSLTLASFRLDALLSGCLNISRDKAKKLVLSGRVAVNHSECTACDREFAEGDIITVKGEGKFLCESLMGLTAKKKQRVIVRKYI